MPRFPRATGKQMIAFLKQQGFLVIRVRGSHHAMEKDHLRTTVPLHGNQPLKIGTLRGIIKDIDMSPHEFENLWDKF